MYLLAFESSCDDTSVALLRNEELVSMRTHTQIEHIATQGVVPEVAARLHANHIFGLIDEVLAEAKLTIADIDVFAATTEPGLVPSLLIGKTVAKTLAISHKKPLIWVNHIEGHVFSLLLERKLEEIEFPVIVLSASGGHNDLFLWHSHYNIEKIGGTTDDSAGESMDKVGRSLGLPFPAGRHIDELAQKYNPEIHTNVPKFPLVMPADSFGFSFSGLKSAAIREIQLRASLLQTQTPLNLPEGETFETENIREPRWLTANKVLYDYVKKYRDELKNNPTETEKIMWEFLKTKKTGHKIRRQHIIGGFIADFVCIGTKTIIEIDGKIHDFQKEYDEMRTQFLREIGFNIIRFTNEEVIKNPEKIAQKIKAYLDSKAPPSEGLGRFELEQSPSFGGVGEVGVGFGGAGRGASGVLSQNDLIEISYGYQETITKILTERLIEAFKKTGAKSMALVGGVSANSRLRGIMEKYSKENNIPYYTPKSLKYCGDNAAMIGVRAYYEFVGSK